MPKPWLGHNSWIFRDIDPRDDDEKPREEKTAPVELTVDISVSRDDPSRILKIGSQLGPAMTEDLSDFLRANLDVFAWTHSDMCGVSPAITSHMLNIDPKYIPVKQKKRGMDPKRAAALREEVDKLKANGFVRDALYPDEWVSNPVLVKKATGKWRTCIDYSDLNKACPKDSFHYISWSTPL